MGTTSSSVSQSNVINKAITDVIMKTVQDCSSYMNINQSVNTSGLNLFGSITESSTLSASCLSNIKMTSDLANAIAANIQQQATQNNVALLPSYTGNASISNVQNIVQNKITDDVIQQCSASLTGNQSVNQSGIQIGSNVTLSASLVSNCIMNRINNTGIASNLIADTSSSTVQKTTGPFDSFINAIASYGMALLAVGGLIVVSYLIYIVISRNKSNLKV